MEKETTHKDPYALFRHFTFHYLHYYLTDFFQVHAIKKQPVSDECGYGGNTLTHLLEGKDMHFNCYARLLTAMREYCKNDEEYMEFVMEFMKRAIIEIWIAWKEKPDEWMLETWEEMRKEKDKYNTLNN